MALARKLASLALLLSPLAGCAGILDIQDATHDPLLDPGGGETLCEKYCAAVQRNCTAAFEQYISTEVCLDVCSHLPPGTEADDATNTAGCRLHYANSAGTVGEKDINCPAAGPGGNGICGTNCEGLCAIAFPTCERLNTFISLADCQGACTVLDRKSVV